MSEDEALRRFPELEYIRQWSEAIDSQNYTEALAILEKGLNLATGRSKTEFVEHFLKLKQLTNNYLTEFATNEEVNAAAKHKISCSFCGKGQEEVKLMVAGAKAFICNECIQLCYQVLVQSAAKS